MDTKKNKSDFRFNNPRLIESIFLENLQYKNNFVEASSIPFQFEKTINKIVELTNGQDCATTVFLSVSTGDEIKFDENTPYYIRVTMKADFVWNKNSIDKEEANNFLNVNAPALLLAYIRPKIHELTVDADIPVQDIPFINFTSDDE